MLIVGSTALKRIAPNYRKPKDLDLFCTKKEMNLITFGNTPTYKGPQWIVTTAYGKAEIILLEDSPAASAYHDYVLQLPDHQKKIARFLYGGSAYVAPVEVLYSLKRSHRFVPYQFQKTIEDYHLLKKLVNGIDIIPHLTALKESETKLKKTPSLMRSKEDFFEDKVSNRTFEHDQMHQIMAHREKPMFEYIKADTVKVACSEEKFNQLSFKEQMQCVLEEAYVIALERCIIPMLYEGKQYCDSERAIRWSLMRICTNLCSGWFREFAVENYPSIWEEHDKDYADRFLHAVDEKRIIRLEKSKQKEALGE